MFRWNALVVILFGMLGTAAGQVNIGQMTQIGMDGTIGTGYGGSFSDTPQSSSHNTYVTGDGQLNGYYFNPQFLNFGVHPYYQRNQSSYNSVSIGDSSGITSSANIFNGSPFPGSVSFSKTYNSTGQYAMPGSASLVTNGNGNSFGIGWAENLAGLPHVAASLNHSTGNSSLVGVEGTTATDSNSWNVNVNHSLAGWPLTANYTHYSNSSSTPETITGIGSDSHGTGSFWLVNSNHPVHFLPNGALSLGYTHSTFSYSSADTLGSLSDGHSTSNGANANLNFSPADRVSASANFGYNDNALSSTVLQLLDSGAVPFKESPGPLRSLFFSGSMSWAAPHGFTVTGGGNRTQQFYQGNEYDATQAWGTVNYNWNSLLGHLYLTAGMNDSATQNGNTGAGFFGTASYVRKILGYDFNANVSYNQNTQTMATFITTSGMGYGTGVRKKLWGTTYWHLNFSGGHSVLSNNNSNTHNERVYTGISRTRISLSTFWAQSYQSYLQTSSGLVATGVETALLSGSLSTFSSTSYGISASVTPIKQMSIVGSYSKEHGNSIGQDIFMSNRSTVEYMYLRYRLRKLFVTASYNRVLQGVTSTGSPLHPLTTYSFGLSRGIKLF